MERKSLKDKLEDAVHAIDNNVDAQVNDQQSALGNNEFYWWVNNRLFPAFDAMLEDAHGTET